MTGPDAPTSRRTLPTQVAGLRDAFDERWGAMPGTTRTATRIGVAWTSVAQVVGILCSVVGGPLVGMIGMGETWFGFATMITVWVGGCTLTVFSGNAVKARLYRRALRAAQELPASGAGAATSTGVPLLRTEDGPRG